MTTEARLKELLECEKPLSKRWRQPNAHKLDAYLADGGYKGLEIAKTKKPEEIIDAMKQANTRGRGGAGFPTGMKWGFLPPNRTETYLVINADESEPGTFKDRYIMERDPHLLLEGIAIASYAIKAQVCYVFIRGEFGLAMQRMNFAIEEAKAKGLFKDIQGVELQVYTHPGAGAYICGEETALLESLEGKRGYPRLKPPFPAVKGAFQKPTIVNNVETIILAPLVMTKGVEWFTKYGIEKCGGTKLYCVSGAVKKPGTYELPHHVTLRELVFDICGGMLPGRQLKGIVPGGSSVPILVPRPAPQLLPPLKEGETRDPKTKIPEEIDVRLDFESLRKVNSFLGSCGIIVIDDKTCIVRALLNLIQFYHHESCGQCTPCREGTGWLERMLLRVERGDGTPNDLETIYSAGKNIMGNTICALGDAAAMPTMSYFEKFKDEFVAHVRDHKCPYPAEEEILPSGWVL
ncbi:MAG: SLBB domain-containing protein [Deltaproteobacteria bacterium]|nr:SLBB domain-containing protein [Deltaproteobacteria bacterium]